MDKPLSARIADMKTKMMEAISESELSPTIVEMVVKDFYMGIKVQCEAYERQEFEQYQKSLETQEAETEGPVSEPDQTEK